MPLETPLLDLHRSAGAIIGEYFGTQLPARFGDFNSEYAAARDEVALVDTNFRSVFLFSGPDAQRYLNALLTSNVRDLKPGFGTTGLLLTPQGHILAEVETLVLSTGILAISHAVVSERTFSTFDKFIIMDDVTIEDLTRSAGTLNLVGPQVAALLFELCGLSIAEIPIGGHAEVYLWSTSCRIVRHQFAGKESAMLIAPRQNLSTLWREMEARVRAFGGAAAGMEAINSIRLEFGTPWFGLDYDDKNIPHEATLEHSHISYEKGCYTGQEIVERVRSRGHANRRVTALQFFSSEAPPTGTKLVRDAAEVGHVTSTGFSPLLDRPIGLGYVRREAAETGTRLDASGIPAEVIVPPCLAAKSSA